MKLAQKFSFTTFEPTCGEANLTNIILLGEDISDDSVLNKIKNSPQFNIKQIKPDKIQKIKNTKNADFIMCSGKIRINDDGEYFIEF